MNSKYGCSDNLVYQFKGETLKERCKLRDELVNGNVIVNGSYYPYKLNEWALELGNAGGWFIVFGFMVVIVVIILSVYFTSGDEGKSKLKILLIISGGIGALVLLMGIRRLIKNWKLIKVREETAKYFSDESVIYKNIRNAVNTQVSAYENTKQPMLKSEADIFRTAYLDNYKKNRDYNEAKTAAIKAFEDRRKK